MRVLYAFIRRAFHIAFIYRIDFWIEMLGVFILMYATHSIWSILYKQSPNAFGMDLERMTTYGVLGIMLMLVVDSASVTEWYIAEQVRRGTLELDLLKPLDFMFHMFSSTVGVLSVVLLTRLVPALIFAYLFLDFRPPASVESGLAFLVSLVLGLLVFFGVSFLFGLLSIVTLDIRNYAWAYHSLIRFASGQIVPLWMFPAPLGAIAAALPFQAVYFVPISIYIDAYQGSVASALLSQGAWAMGLILAGRLFWVRVQRRITIQGG